MVNEYVISQRPEKFRCPKWDGENISTNIKYGYCGYVFREKDYYNDEVSTEKDECRRKFKYGFIRYFISSPIGRYYFRGNIHRKRRE